MNIQPEDCPAPDAIAICDLTNRIIDVVNDAPPMEVKDTITAFGFAFVKFAQANAHIGEPATLARALFVEIVGMMERDEPTIN